MAPAWLSPLGLGVLCGHCALGALASLAGALGLVSVPHVLGVSWSWVWPPVAILGGFSLWLWSGRRGDACEAASAR